MKRTGQCLSVGLVLLAAVWLGANRGQAGGAKSDPWQPIVPKEVYKELAKREAERIQDILKGTPDEKALHRARFGAMLIAALAQSVEGGATAETNATFEAAWQLAKALGNKGGLDQAKTFVALLITPDPKRKLLEAPKDWYAGLTKADLMDHFRPQAKGGDGMHPDLQSNIKFKGALNGIEEKIRYLSLKELSPAAMKKEAKELELLGYRSAVVGELTFLYAPATKEAGKDPADWRRYSLATRDTGVELAKAAAKGDTAAVLRTGNALNGACSQCHSEFRSN
jgi:hypothetical protein